MRMGGRVTVANDLVFDRARGRDRADADAAAEMLGDRDDVGDDAFGFKSEHLPELAQTGLLFIDDQQHVARMAHLLQRLEPAGRRLDDTARAEQRLGDDRGRPARRLGIEQLEAGFQAGELAARKGLVERTAVAIGGDDRVGAARQMAVAGMPARKGDGACRVGQAVETDVRARDLKAAGVFAGDHHRHFIGVGAGFSEQALLQRARHDRAEARGELDFLHVVVARMRVDHGIARVLDGCRDGRVVVAERRAHLAGIEIKVFLAGDIEDDRSGAALEHRSLVGLLVHAGAKGKLRRRGKESGLARGAGLSRRGRAVGHRKYPFRIEAVYLRMNVLRKTPHALRARRARSAGDFRSHSRRRSDRGA